MIDKDKIDSRNDSNTKHKDTYNVIYSITMKKADSGSVNAGTIAGVPTGYAYDRFTEQITNH